MCNLYIYIHIIYISYTYHIITCYIYICIETYILHMCVCMCVISRCNCWLNTIVTLTIPFTHSLQLTGETGARRPRLWAPACPPQRSNWHLGRTNRTRVREDFSWENPNGKIMGFHGERVVYNGESLFNRYLMRYFMGLNDIPVIKHGKSSSSMELCSENHRGDLRFFLTDSRPSRST